MLKFFKDFFLNHFTIESFLLSVALPLAIIWLLTFIVWHLSWFFIKQNKQRTVRIRLKFTVKLVLFLILTISSFYFILEYFKVGLFGTIRGGFATVLSTPIISSSDFTLTLFNIIWIIVLFVVASWISSAIRMFTSNKVLAHLHIAHGSEKSALSVIKYVSFIFVIIVGLPLIGINLSSLLVVFSIVGLGLGIGFQDVVANFFAGVVIIFTQPIKEGNRISVDGTEGDVINIRMLHTVINTLTNETIIMPNKMLVWQPVHNISFSEDKSITVLTSCQVSYTSDVEKALFILTQVAAESEFRKPESPYRANLISFDDSGITLRVAMTISDLKNKWIAISDLNLEIWKRFAENDISMPFPQRDLHIKTMDKSVVDILKNILAENKNES